MLHDIRAALQQEVDAWEKLGHPSLLLRFVLACGTIKPGRPRPEGVEKRADKECFMNSTHMTWNDPRKYKYVEGYAISEIGWHVHHAWNEDTRGRVIDTTWKNPERCTYMGIKLTATELMKELHTNKVYGVLDTGLGYNARFIYARAPELREVVENLRRQTHAA